MGKGNIFFHGKLVGIYINIPGILMHPMLVFDGFPPTNPRCLTVRTPLRIPVANEGLARNPRSFKNEKKQSGGDDCILGGGGG